MNIVIAPDSFKGSLTAAQAAAAIETGIKRILPGAECIKLPMADGGEGTVAAILAARKGQLITRKVRDPAGKKISASYGLIDNGQTAVIEMAGASGMDLLQGSKINPLKTSTYGTGELIIDAIEHGVKNIIVGTGGSATVDCGAGMAAAMGVRFRDCHGRLLRVNMAGGMLDRIAAIDLENIHPGLSGVCIIAAADVTNKLCGETGAARMFGPQKCATPGMVEQLEQNLRHFAELINKQLGINVLDLQGGGAAGGLAAGLAAFTGAELHSGFAIVARLTRLEKFIRAADLVLTGEGCIDAQTAFGKTPAGVAKIAARYDTPVVAIGGSLGHASHELYKYGISAMAGTVCHPMSLQDAMNNAAAYLSDAAERTLRLIHTGIQISKKLPSELPTITAFK
jgi:glycerate kinase